MDEKRQITVLEKKLTTANSMKDICLHYTLFKPMKICDSDLLVIRVPDTITRQPKGLGGIIKDGKLLNTDRGCYSIHYQFCTGDFQIHFSMNFE